MASLPLEQALYHRADGEAPELRQYFVAAGFNSAGIANSGGAGRLIAEWIVGGEAPSDLWEVDIRRFGPFMANRRALAQRTGETLGLHYAMRWPRQELTSARPLRTSPLYDRLAARGAVFGAKNGWERANYFKPAGGQQVVMFAGSVLVTGGGEQNLHSFLLLMNRQIKSIPGTSRPD